MDPDQKNVERLVRDLRRDDNKFIERIANRQLQNIEHQEWLASPEGILCRSGREFAMLLHEGHHLEQAQMYSFLGKIAVFMGRGEKESDRVLNRRVKTARGEPYQPFQSPKKAMYPTDNYLNGYAFAQEPSKTFRGEYAFEQDWYFRALHHNDSSVGVLLGRRMLPSFWDLDIYRRTFESSNGRGGADHRYHLRMFMDKLEIIAYEDGEPLDPIAAVGRDVVSEAQALISAASEELQQHLSTKKR